MLPEDWSDDPGPELFDLPDDLSRLFDCFHHRLAGGTPFEVMMRIAVGCGANKVMLERGYIDVDYRSEFVNFYAQTFRALPDRCQRLHFIDADAERYFGFSVMRPIIGRPISRTVLAPPPGLAPHVSCLTRTRASPYGYVFAVRGFPFISQDYQYGRCAHAAIWMVALYFHLAFRKPRYYISDIVDAARESAYVFRHTPSSGLTHLQISAALDALGMSPINYILDDLPVGETAETIACRYLNSRLPVILLGDSHARVLIGYGSDTDGKLFFICNDDARGPYRAIGDAQMPYVDKDVGTPNWERLVVPTPGRIYLSAESAEREGWLALEQEMRKHPHLKQLVKRCEHGEFRLRTYATEIGEYKHKLRSRGLSSDLCSWHARIGSSHWVWVVELQEKEATAKGIDCVVGEVVIDATSDDIKPNFLVANLPGKMMRWTELGAPTQTADSEQSDRYRSGSALHVPAPFPKSRSRTLQRLSERFGKRNR